ncbi:uncharacterized protein LOC119381293 [Rhipicephalus sanguineus]|uniref:uncharacterized protein LOC119381293 n=1 Tax=Rhipicephalus sanguineus TaxID=34632 RepID=UPI0020C2E271|nr:uncharacterized protein LOC119381293 [Rhipicephalus sanguineus]
MKRASILRNLRKTNHIREHLVISYRNFNATLNDSRLDEILNHTGIFLDFADKVADSDLTPVTFNDSTKFFEFTPSLSKERWRAILNRYIKKPIESYSGVTIHGVDYFKAVFEMHKNGEDVMNDIVETVAVQNLVPFTSMDMIDSFHRGQGEESSMALKHTCFELLYPSFGYVVNEQLLHNLEQTKRHARELAETIRATFINSVTESSKNQTVPIGDDSAPKSNHTLEIVFGNLDRSVPSMFPPPYKNYPNITEDPLQNWVNIDRYYSELSSVPKNTFIKYSEADYGTFINFEMMLHYLMFPFAGDDAHVGVFTGGIGLKFAATIFYQLVEEAGDAAAGQIYKRNHQCLELEGSEVDKDLQGAVAAVPVTQRLYSRMREEDDYKKLLGGIQLFTEEQVPFAAGCYLLCGETRGTTLCNMPLMHSADFARAFGCSDHAIMNPRKKCAMVTHT